MAGLVLALWLPSALYASALAAPRATPPVRATRFSTTNVPPAVKAAVTRLYPTVTAIQWEQEGKNYEASLTYKGRHESVLLAANGTLLETEIRIPATQLPASVRQYVTRHYRGKAIDEAAEIHRANGQKTYEAEVAGKDLLFSDTGAFIR